MDPVEEYKLQKGITEEQWNALSARKKRKITYVSKFVLRKQNFKEISKLIWNDTKGECVYCEKFIPLENRTVDHILSRTASTIEDVINNIPPAPRLCSTNIVPSCYDCNQKRNKAGNPTACLFGGFKYFFYILKKEIIVHKELDKRRIKQP
jgi:5-methylcytosine-specific restriction endonuclease McrA